MTNAERYKLSGIEAYNLSHELGEYLTIEKKAEGVFVSDINSFFAKATKPTLTEDERVILRNIDNMCKTIYREKYTGHIRTTLYCPQPDGLCGEELRCFDNLFQFIKERRRILYRRTFERRIRMDWIISQAPDTTKIPTGDNLLYIIQTTEIIDTKGNLYKKVDVSTLVKDKQIEEQKPNVAQSSFKKFSERGITQRRRTHTNKRAKRN